MQIHNEQLRFANQEGAPEIFHTIQGEGRSIGEPAVFARLSGCNLQCNWCDTPYTWNWEGTPFEHDEGVKYDRKAETLNVAVGEAVDQVTGYNCRRLVISGGEPLLQKKMIVPFLEELRLRDPDHWVEIETNGTIVPGEELSALVDQFNVSPKLANSNNTPEKREKPRALEAFAAMPNADFKFVVQGDEDMDEVLGLMARYEIPPERTYLMPEGRTREEVETRQRQLVEVCKANNINLTTRLHVLIWGAKRGV